LYQSASLLPMLCDEAGERSDTSGTCAEAVTPTRPKPSAYDAGVPQARSDPPRRGSEATIRQHGTVICKRFSAFRLVFGPCFATRLSAPEASGRVADSRNIIQPSAPNGSARSGRAVWCARSDAQQCIRLVPNHCRADSLGLDPAIPSGASRLAGRDLGLVHERPLTFSQPSAPTLPDGPCDPGNPSVAQVHPRLKSMSVR
jgi:hypothetical protein